METIRKVSLSVQGRKALQLQRDILDRQARHLKRQLRHTPSRLSLKQRVLVQQEWIITRAQLTSLRRILRRVRLK